MHTPGPWRQGTKNQRFMNLVYAHNGGILVAEVNTSAPEPGENEANARLIAAAPELLAAIQNLLDCTELNMDSLEDHTRWCIETAIGAIAKATGQR
jgi:hypothetical protein